METLKTFFQDVLINKGRVPDLNSSFGEWLKPEKSPFDDCLEINTNCSRGFKKLAKDWIRSDVKITIRI